MRHTKEPARFTPFEWIVTLLLTTCAAMLGACTALIWFYPPTLAREVNSSVAAKNQIELGAALLTLKEQQVLSNTKLDEIRNELHVLNEKAGTAASVTPPP
jgi:hypothetical protein